MFVVVVVIRFQVREVLVLSAEFEEPTAEFEESDLELVYCYLVWVYQNCWEFEVVVFLPLVPIVLTAAPMLFLPFESSDLALT